MALTRKFLSAMGIESEKIDQIIEAHTDTTDALKKERDKYKGEADKVPDLEKQVKDLTAANGDGKKTYKELYESEKSEFEKYKSDQVAKESNEKKSAAYKTLLKKAGITDNHINTILKASDYSKVEFDDKGEVKDSDKIVKGIQEEWKDIIPDKQTEGADVSHPPKNEHGSGRTGYAAKFEDQYYSKLWGTANNDGGNK